MRIYRLPAMMLAAVLPCFAAAQQDTQKEIERYRQLLQDGNPSELFEARGAEHWKAKRGPKNASLEQCDLGLGAGVVRGAYVRLPRYFADSDKVEDLESRLVTCMVALQGLTPEEAKRRTRGVVVVEPEDLDVRHAFGRRLAERSGHGHRVATARAGRGTPFAHVPWRAGGSP